MDEDLVRKVRETLLARVSCPAPNIYNIVIPISETAADGLLNAFCDALQKRDDNGTNEKYAKNKN